MSVGAKSSSLAIIVSQTNVAWICEQGIQNSAETAHAAICLGTVGASPGSTITVANPAATTLAMCAVVAEYSGLGTGPIYIDKAGLAATGNTAAPATTAFTTVDAVQLLIGSLNHRGQWSTTEQTNLYSGATNSFVLVDPLNGGGATNASTFTNGANADIATAMLERITSSTVSGITAGATITSAQWSSNGIALRVVTGGGQRSWVGTLPIINFLNKYNLLHPHP